MAPKLSSIGKKGREEFKKEGIKANGSTTGLKYIRSVGVGRRRKKK